MKNIVKPLSDEEILQWTAETSAIQRVPAAQSGVWVLIATILGSSMAFIDGTVVNVALPVLQLDLKATVADVQWVVEAYALFLAALILVGGSIGDHFGRRRIFAIGIALPAGLNHAAQAAIQQAIAESFVTGFRVVMLIAAGLALAGALSASLLIKKRG